MKKTKRILALLLALLMLFTMSVTVLSGCDSGSAGDGETSGSDTSGSETSGSETTGGSSDTTGGSSGTEPDPPVTGNIDYTVKLVSAGGLPLSNVALLFWNDAEHTDMAQYGTTDENGSTTVSLPAGKDYHVTISSGLPKGYTVADNYPVTSTATTITLTSSVIADTNLSGVRYELGSVMYDFSFVDTDGNTITLSEVLKTKKAVLINFFYAGCAPCVSEVPYMEEAYQMYKDDIEILALNPYQSETQETVKTFKATYELSFPMGKDIAGVKDAMASFGGYPTSLIVDRYGVICLIETGALPAFEPFDKMFEYFTSDNYVQKLFTSVDELIPEELPPEGAMPSSDELAAALGTTELGFVYAPETNPGDAEYSWHFAIGEKNGETCIYPANQKKAASFATLYITMNLKKGDVVAFDYYSSTEAGVDGLYLLVNREIMRMYSGQGSDWESSYAYVAPKDGEFEVVFCYLKDSTTDVGEDTVYIKDLRILSTEDIDKPTYIPRTAASEMREDGFGYENYVEVVYNEEDGYYHVGAADGPLLLADLLTDTLFSNESVQSMAMNNKLGEEFYDDIVNYLSYATNSSASSYTPVTTELRELLEIVAETVGIENHENEWLQMCIYYEAYGTNGAQFEDPTKGLWYHSAFDAQLGDGNVVNYDRVFMPRGFWYEFIPQTSGVYRITSLSESTNELDRIDGWIFLQDGTTYCQYNWDERMHADLVNCSMVVYLEAGTPYYIDLAYWDVQKLGTFNFEIEYVAPSLELFVMASPGPFVGYEAPDGSTVDMGEVVAGGVDVALGEDGYYHVLNEDGSLGSILYADFINTTEVFSSYSLLDLTKIPYSYNYALSEDDQWVLTFIQVFENDGYTYEEGFRIEWGDEYDYYMELYQVEDVVAGRYHGNGKDYTETIMKYVEQMIEADAEHPELEGCVPVNEELATILQALMDKFTFEGVEHSWTKLCYYYKPIGPTAES